MMNTKINFIVKAWMLLWAVGSLLSACNDAERAAIDNLVYITEASVSKTKEVKVSGEGATTTTITVRMAQSVEQEVSATLVIDESLLEQYNKLHETDYRLPDEQYIHFEKSVTITPGNVSASPVQISIDPFEMAGGQFAIPLKINSTQGGVSMTESSSSLILILSKVLSQPVPKFQNNRRPWEPVDLEGFGIDPTDAAWGLELENFTIEFLCKMSGFNRNNQTVVRTSGSPGLTLRFGDELYAPNYNFFQVKAFGSQFDSGDPTVYGLKEDQWYHIAVTYEASLGQTKMYIDGELRATMNTDAGVTIRVDAMRWVASGQWTDFCELCQIRFWKIARTQGQIQKNMYSEVDAKDKNLIYYLPLNEGSCDELKLNDITGNGHNVTDISRGTFVANNPWTVYTFDK